MRVLVTGASGFIGGRLAAKLRGRGDDVVTVVRSSARAGHLLELGCEVVEIDFSRSSLAAAMSGCDGVYHLAGKFELGVDAVERPAFGKANPALTGDVIDAAVDTGIERVVYASTINVFGDTRGAVVDERYKREADEFLSLYDESKFRAHEVALDRVELGAPVIIVQPGVVYGPGDHFEIGRQILLAARGRLPAVMLGATGFSMCFVDDVADGFIAAFDKGRVGESYVLGGEVTRLRDVLRMAAYLCGRRFNAVPVPTALLRAVAPLGPLVGPKLGYPPNFDELIRVSDGTTYWADDGKARRELGYAGRDLEAGLLATLEEEGLLPRPV